MIRYELPDFTANLGLNLFFARLFLACPSYMQEDVCIDALYGSFPDCPLNGGRTYLRPRASAQEIDRTYAILDEYGIRPRLTFTNMLAGAAELADPYVNLILEKTAEHNGQVIVYSDEVADYVRTQFGLPIILSTTRELDGVEGLNEALERFDWVVLDYNLNKNEDALARVERLEKLEVMVNEFCMPGCPNRHAHYLHNSREQLERCMTEFPCSANKPDFFRHEPGHPTIFTGDEVRATHERHGIEQFKIVGRGIAFSALLEVYAYYLVKPEYRETVVREARRQAGK